MQQQQQKEPLELALAMTVAGKRVAGMYVRATEFRGSAQGTVWISAPRCKKRSETGLCDSGPTDGTVVVVVVGSQEERGLRDESDAGQKLNSTERHT